MHQEFTLQRVEFIAKTDNPENLFEVKVFEESNCLLIKEILEKDYQFSIDDKIPALAMIGHFVIKIPVERWEAISEVMYGDIINI